MRHSRSVTPAGTRRAATKLPQPSKRSELRSRLHRGGHKDVVSHTPEQGRLGRVGTAAKPSKISRTRPMPLPPKPARRDSTRKSPVPLPPKPPRKDSSTAQQHPTAIAATASPSPGTPSWKRVTRLDSAGSGHSASSHVTVAVRVRPLVERERRQGLEVDLTVHDRSVVTLVHPGNTEPAAAPSGEAGMISLLPCYAAHPHMNRFALLQSRATSLTWRWSLVCAACTAQHPCVCVSSQHPAEVDNKEFYRLVGSTLVSQLLGGEHVTVLAYGATGHGKTYTLTGAPPTHNRKAVPGLVQLLTRDLFAALRNR